jgi:hypothetical protein
MGRVRADLRKMNTPDAIDGYYFAFPRLIHRLLGGTAERRENNWVEAYGTGVFIYLLSYVYAVDWFELKRDSVLSLLALIPLLFGMWIFWLVVVYLNSLVIKALRVAGWIDRSAKPGAQSVLLSALTSLFALDVARMDSVVRWLALAWFVMLALNIFSAAVLAFVPEPEAPEPA